jgi:glucokinase
MPNASLRIIADVGGTKCAFAQSDPSGHLIADSFRVYPCAHFATFTAALSDYAKSERIHSLVVGVAGPVIDGKCRTTNLPWTLDVEDLRKTFNFERCLLLNDMAIQLHGLADLPSDGVKILQNGRASGDTTGLIAVGTGLGEGWMIKHDSNLVVGASEGSHADFGPRDQLQTDLLNHVRQAHQHVSWERIVSGSFGFANIYRFLKLRGVPSGNDFNASLPDHDYGPEVVAAANAGCPRSEKTIELFISCLGAEAGNLALKVKATQGIYVSGGVTQFILPWLTSRTWFMDAFRDKGRFREFMESIPVKIVTDTQLPLRGAAQLSTL